MENNNLYQKTCLISTSQPVKSFKSFKSFCPGTLQSKGWSLPSLEIVRFRIQSQCQVFGTGACLNYIDFLNRMRESQGGPSELASSKRWSWKGDALFVPIEFGFILQWVWVWEYKESKGWKPVAKINFLTLLWLQSELVIVKSRRVESWEKRKRTSFLDRIGPRQHHCRQVMWYRQLVGAFLAHGGQKFCQFSFSRIWIRNCQEQVL